MDPETLEVFCPNPECGDPEVHMGTLVATSSRRYRRMNYMGKSKVGAGQYALRRFLGDEDKRLHIGVYHNYQCPVCGKCRQYLQQGDALFEV